MQAIDDLVVRHRGGSFDCRGQQLRGDGTLRGEENLLGDDSVFALNFGSILAEGGSWTRHYRLDAGSKWNIVTPERTPKQN